MDCRVLRGRSRWSRVGLRWKVGVVEADVKNKSKSRFTVGMTATKSTDNGGSEDKSKNKGNCKTKGTSSGDEQRRG